MDLEAKKIALRKIHHGVYVAGVKQGEQLNAFTITWVTQASFTPPLVAIGVKKDSHSFDMLKAGGVFSLNVLGRGTGRAIAEHFVTPTAVAGEKLATAGYTVGVTGAPILSGAIAYVECQVREIANGLGDHAIIVGEVVEAGVRQKDEPSLALSDTGWHYGG